VTQVPGPPPPAADIEVTKVAGTQAVNVGDDLTYRITATNRGPGSADAVVLTDTPDAGTTFTLTATARGRGTARDITVCDRLPRGFTMRDPGGARLRAGRWCWQIAALQAGRSRTLRIVTTAPKATAPTRVMNVAVLSVGDQAPRFAIARVRILAQPPSFTG
jgi:uncharacterized repeat protein (TIGR01451 family)